MKKIFLGIILVLLCACGTSGVVEKQTVSVSGKIVELDDNGNVDIDISNTDFINAGFNYGDSVYLELENGYILDDIPFLSGMYVEYGKCMVYGKASKDKVSFIQKYKSFIDSCEVREQLGFTIKLNETGKYSNIENVGNLKYSNDFSYYNDEAVFANFREVTVGDIKPGRLYRSASVIDNTENRVNYTSKLALDNRIKTIINVKDKQEDFDNLVSNLEGDSKTLIENTRVINAPISTDYQSEKSNKIIIDGLSELVNNDYPYLIHCLEGKDRTGYTMAVIEALCNATYQEIVDDYMITYDNYYGVNKQADIDKYNYIKESNIDAMLRFIASSDDLNNVNYQEAAIKFLKNYGMSEENLQALINRLCK